MSSLLRLLQIIHCIGRYRLDCLLEAKYAPLSVRLLLLAFHLYPENKDARGKRLRYALEELGPIFVKFGQLLSTRPDLIPSDIVEELNQLQDNVAPFNNDVFRGLVEHALGDSVENLFLSYDHQPLASASVAQVHTAILKDGTDVIIKAVRPGIEKIIEKDIGLLHLIATFVEQFSHQGKRLKPVEIIADYRLTIFDELNLNKEAANASQLRRNFSNSNMLYIPEIYWDYTRENVIVMERIYGIPVTNMAELKAQDTDLKLLAERGVEVFFTQVFDHNFFHADMHPGNVFVSYDDPRQPSYIAVDMAIVGSLTREDQYYLARNLIAMFRRDYRQVAELHVLSGWVPKHTSISGFESAIRTVCEPLFEKPLKDISFGQALINLFKTAQRFDMPIQPQLVLLQKTLLNIEGLGRQLYPELNLWDTAHPYLEKWIKTRYHPKTIGAELRYYAPDWLEKLPQIPYELVNTLESVKQLAQSSIEKNKQPSVPAPQTKRKKYQRISALVLFSIGMSLIWPQLHEISPSTIGGWLIVLSAVLLAV
ncbi:MAG: ubiquinone biosynthesis regulatory protein kinase UbiB [Alteromonadaceae bacterium]|nr:MAG: ubiquinone biosynthesis regulatory protein kinase UbiB [Alteromonadaceae bacterium]